MNYKNEDFVGVYKDFVSEEFCDAAIEYYKNMHEMGQTKDRLIWQKTNKHHKEDQSVCSSFEDSISLLETKEIFPTFLKKFWEDIDLYIDDYSILTDLPEQPSIYICKIQHTRVGGGYHVWHCEDMSKMFHHRLLTFILYLNDVDEGGETELLYFNKRFKPEKGTLIVFPANFTHTHRGNPPISNEKYIITGWVEL
jgi:hypothetical protein